jgi:predicted methyltransferase
MHRIEGCDPLEDTRAKVSALGRRLRGLVLDTCMGLGYTAIEALKRGAFAVVTIEIDPAIIALAQLNPWSRPLATASTARRAAVVLGDSTSIVKSLPSEVFDYVIHDPPRFELAGELYSEEFYRELFRVAKPGAKIFHYTGEPGKHGGPSIVKGVKRRLEAAGFVQVRWVDSAKGFVALRPGSQR